MGLRSGRTLFESVPALSQMGPDSQRKGILRLIPRDGDGEIHTLAVGRVTLGRDDSNPIILTVPQASRVHCEITVSSDGQVWLRDLDSANGTYVNSQRTTNLTQLSPGDELWFSEDCCYRLAYDEHLVAPVNVDLGAPDWDQRETMTDLGDHSHAPGQTPASGGPAAQLAANALQRGPEFSHQPPMPAPEPPTGPVTGHEPPRAAPEAEELQSRLKVLAILYQVTLRCLELKTLPETEELLTNVLKRLAAFEWGFIAYSASGSMKASLVAGVPAQPPRDALQKISHYANMVPGPLVVTEPSHLSALAVERSSLLIIPMRIEDQLVGLISCATNRAGFDAEVVDILLQLSNICTVGLVKRWL